MDRIGAQYYLRPPHGGVEWEVPPDQVRPALASDRLRPVVAELNAWSRRSAPWG
ncbi:hypothetical protein ACWD6I_00765 [Streptomyces sp. NPDC002454]